MNVLLALICRSGEILRIKSSSFVYTKDLTKLWVKKDGGEGKGKVKGGDISSFLRVVGGEVRYILGKRWMDVLLFLILYVKVVKFVENGI